MRYTRKLTAGELADLLLQAEGIVFPMILVPGI